MEIEQLMDEDQGLELTEGNIETVLDEIRPYLVGELGYCSVYLMCPLLDIVMACQWMHCFAINTMQPCRW